MESKYNLETISRICNGDKLFIHEFISLFVNTAPRMMEEANEAGFVKDWPRVGEILHRIRPTVEMFGMTIAPVMKETELKAKTGEDPPTLSANMKEISLYINEAIDQLKIELEKL